MSGRRPAKRASNPLTRKVKKSEMVSYLTSTGRIKPHQVSSLYDSGLDRWSHLIDRTKPEFMEYTGVGAAVAEALMALGEIKKVELLSVNGELDTRKMLKETVKLDDRGIDELMAKGFNSLERLARAFPEQISKVKGIDREAAEGIILQARAALAPRPEIKEPPMEEAPSIPPVIEVPPPPPPPAPPAEGAPTGEPLPSEPQKESIEEATALSAEEAPKEPPKEEAEKQGGFFSKFLGGIKGFFSGKKEQPPTAPPTTAPEEAPKPAEGAPQPAEAPPEQPPAEIKVEEEKAPEAPPAPEPAPEAAPPPPEPEPPKEETSPQEAAAPVEAPPPTTEEPKPSFFQRMKEKLMGGKKPAPAPAEEQPAGAEPAGPPAAPEEAKVEEQGPPEAPQEGPAPEGPPALERFEDIPGITPEVAGKLYGSGYMNISELREAIPDDLMMIEGIDKEMAERICLALK